MDSKEEAYYEAFGAKDSRLDGRVFVGVSSTGIYCRPTCHARHPKKENCTFFKTAAEAEQAGYRPCLLCRPELAPGNSIVDAKENLVNRAVILLEENCGTGMSLDQLSEELGCSSRHLRRVFKQEYNVTPIQYLQTCKLLLAKNLLTDTNLSVLDVAMTSGFGSLRRFNDLFKKHYKLSPSALRKHLTKSKREDGKITLSLSYRPPYLWKKTIDFLSERAIPGVEKIENDAYYRTVRIQNLNNETVCGWLKVQNLPNKNRLSVTVSDSLLSALPRILTRIKNLFDLKCDPNIIYKSLSSMNNVKPGLCVLGTRLPGGFDSFEMAVRAVLGQQITVKAAKTLAGRIVERFGNHVATEIDGLTHVFPTPLQIVEMKDLVEDNLGQLGVIAYRSKTIYQLAEKIVSGDIDLKSSAQPEKEIKKLMDIKGIGSWTAQYIAMRTMGYTDSFLETDVGVKNALSGYTPKELIKIAETWRPWRSYATMNLWNSL